MRIPALIGALVLALLPHGARAQLGGGFESDQCFSIGTAVSGVVTDTSSVCANSYTAGQVVDNLQQFSSPAETTVCSASPLVLGGTNYVLNNADPVFTGNPGQKGSYWLLNGSAFFTLPCYDNDFIGRWGDTIRGKDFSLFETFQFHASGARQSLMSTKYGSGADLHGVNLWIETDNSVNFTQQGDTGSTTVRATTTLTDGFNYAVGVGHSGNTTCFWIGKTTGECFTQNFNASNTPAAGRLAIGALSGGSLPMASGTRYYNPAFIANWRIDDAAMATIISWYETQQGLVFHH